MPAQTRIGNKNTGHDACPSVSLIEGSPDVFINGQKAGRVGDHYASHSCKDHSSHQDYIAQGSSTVFINDVPAGRVGDPVIIGGSVAEGSSNVFVGG
ncbi:PAAR domain-containing protein [Selenomonadales bacterium OttesenSCG-928-I06]|nr:PAAR domain-containing protein [Selenomonadales bacterium OttesenSCG-928-I06]